MAKYIVIHGIRIDKDYQNFVPETFGRLTTIGPRFQIGDRVFQVCKCRCRSCVVVRKDSLVGGGTTSCGCFSDESRKNRNYKHGEANKTKEFTSWIGMIGRCKSKRADKKKYYLDAGVEICDRWLDPVNGYANFLADMGRKPSPSHTIDRYPDPDGNYEPGNCRWATPTEQVRNRRNTIKITAFGKTLTVSEWAEITGLPYHTILRRFQKGHLPEKLLQTKARSVPNPRLPDA